MKHQNLISRALSIVALLAITSCTKVIQLDLGTETARLVIEGNITNIKGTQTVKLTQNVAFTNTNTYPAVTGATVSISDQTGNKYTLTETAAGTYTINNVAGLSGNTYTMSVLTGGKTYTAPSVMPAVVQLDSITAKNNEISNGSGPKKKVITVHYQDPIGIANQYRFVMYVNGVEVKRIFAYNDDFIDGRYVNLDIRQSDIDIYAGDTVMVEFQCVDKPIYTYWYTLNRQQPQGPGGGVTPADPPTNISPVSLGYFSAHTTQVKTLVVK